MKKQETLPELVAELERQLTAKRDFVADTSALRYEAPAPEQPEGLVIEGQGRYALTPHTHTQLADRLGIPKRYYDRLRQDAPDLLAENVNHWFQQAPERRLIRTLDHTARAYLSERYRPLDHYDLALAVLPRLRLDDMQLESLALTPTRMYIKAVSPRLEGEVKPGDVVQAGIVVSNSEVGAGSVKIEPMVYRLVCMNGLIAGRALNRYHVGKGLGGDGDADALAREWFRDDTRRLDDAAFFAKVRDVVAGALSTHGFRQMLTALQEAAGQKIPGDPVKVVEVTAKRFGLSDEERGGVLHALISGGELSQYGLVNALTAYSQADSLSYERATELERTGGAVLELPPSEWQALVDVR